MMAKPSHDKITMLDANVVGDNCGVLKWSKYIGADQLLKA